MTDLGVLGGGRLGAVDRAGAITPAGAGWALDWWVGAEDRWHVPAVEAAVRQSLVDATPVVETRMRVPGGDVVHRAFGATGGGGTPALVVEVENQTPTPVAVALVVRGNDAVELDGELVRVDGVPAVRLPRAPGAWAAPAAFLPLPHRATLRLAAAAGAEPPALDGLAPAERVASGWHLQADGAARIVVPDPALSEAVAAARAFLRLHPEADLLATALLAEAAGAWGDERAPFPLADAQTVFGGVEDPARSLAATGQALYAVAAVPGEQSEELAGAMAKSAHWIERRRVVRRHRKDALRARLLPAGPQPAVLGAEDQTYADDWWSIAGQARAARLLEDLGQVEAAVDAARFARGLAADVDRSITTLTAGGADAPIPPGPGRDLDAAVVGAVVAAAIGGADPADPHVRATLDLVRAELTDADGGVAPGVLGTGCSPWLTALLARVEAATGDARACRRLRHLLALAPLPGAWPELVGGDAMVDVPLADHHPLATAAFLTAVRTLLVVERGPHLGRPDTLAVLPVLPPEWVGQGIEAHDLPTAFGTFAFAVRWHGERPALLWETTGHDPDCPLRLVAPGLDPSWATTEPTGEALLA